MTYTYDQLAPTKMLLIARAMELIHSKQQDIITHIKEDDAYEELRIPAGADNSPESIVHAINGMGFSELKQFTYDLDEAAQL